MLLIENRDQIVLNGSIASFREYLEFLMHTKKFWKIKKKLKIFEKLIFRYNSSDFNETKSSLYFLMRDLFNNNF